MRRLSLRRGGKFANLPIPPPIGKSGDLPPRLIAERAGWGQEEVREAVRLVRGKGAAMIKPAQIKEAFMFTVVNEVQQFNVPTWVTDLESFRRWNDSDDFPDEVPIWWLKGKVWIDMSREQIFTHVRVKTKLTMALGLLAEQEHLGLYLTDGVLLSNFAADISGNPDGLFLSNATLASDRIRLIEGREGGFTELQGSPDMVLEIISRSSQQKDDVVLRQAYWEADVPEYWIVDVRKEPIRFDILRHSKRGYTTARKQEGWVKSPVFGRSFRLVVRPGPGGHPDYSLEMR
jgi:Uma2 family endonuclease